MINLDREPPKATIAWVAPNGGAPCDRVREAMGAAGYRLVDEDAATHLDLAIVDLREVADPEIARGRSAEAWRLAPDAGVLFVSSGITHRMMRRTEICRLHTDATPLILAVRERLRLASLAEELGDRMKSTVADGRPLSFNADFGNAQLAVLIAGNPGPLMLAAQSALGGVAGGRTISVFNGAQAMRALDCERFEAAVFLPSEKDDLLLALARALRRHREHRRTAIVMASADEALLARAARDGFSAVHAHDVERDLAGCVGLAARRTRLAAAMRGFLPGNSGRAASTRFFALHSKRVFRRADETGHPVSLIALSFGESALASDARRVAMRMLRAEDLIAKLSADTLVVMLRRARQREAERAAMRLESGVAAALSRRSPSVNVAAQAVERRKGDRVEETVAALVRSLRDSQTRQAAI